jgi:hypothetical protein
MEIPSNLERPAVPITLPDLKMALDTLELLLYEQVANKNDDNNGE